VIDRDNDLDPLFCRRSLLVRPDGGAVDHLDLAVVRGADGVHQPVPYACLSPSVEAVVAGGAWSVALGQVAPRRPGSQHPEDAVQHTPIVDTRHTSRLVGQERLDHAPLEVGQVVSAHADAESVFRRRRKVCLALADVSLAYKAPLPQEEVTRLTYRAGTFTSEEGQPNATPLPRENWIIIEDQPRIPSLQRLYLRHHARAAIAGKDRDRLTAHFCRVERHVRDQVWLKRLHPSHHLAPGPSSQGPDLFMGSRPNAEASG
jgi:hypothetical protein